MGVCVCFQADEELLLLEALDMYGLGNWSAIGDHCNRPPQQCAAHYESIYLRSPAFPLATPAPEMDGVCPVMAHARTQTCMHVHTKARVLLPALSGLPSRDAGTRDGWGTICSRMHPSSFSRMHARTPACTYTCTLESIHQRSLAFPLATPAPEIEGLCSVLFYACTQAPLAARTHARTSPCTCNLWLFYVTAPSPEMDEVMFCSVSVCI